MKNVSMTRTLVSYLLVFTFFAFNSVGFTLAQDSQERSVSKQKQIMPETPIEEISQKRVPPQPVPRNADCAFLQIGNTQLTYSGSLPAAPQEPLTHGFNTGQGFMQVGQLPPDPLRMIQVLGVRNPGPNINGMSYTSAITLKGMVVYPETGNASFYDYRNINGARDDSGLLTINGSKIIGFAACYGGGTTAADITIRGRTVDENGQAIPRATVTMVSQFGARTAMTSAFGYYIFDAVPNGTLVQLYVTSKRFDFGAPLTITDTQDSVAVNDFIGKPRN